MNRKMVIGSLAALAVVATGGGAFAIAGDGDRSAQEGGAAASRALAAGTAEANPLRCYGEAQKTTRAHVVNQPVIVDEAAGDVSLPGAFIPVPGPVNGADVLNVTFSAETQLRGNTAGDQFDWAEFEVLLDGLPMQPVGPPDSPMALTGSSTYAMNAAQFCGRIGPGTHRLSTRLRIVDNGTDDALSVWIDDYVLRAETSN